MSSGSADRDSPSVPSPTGSIDIPSPDSPATAADVTQGRPDGSSHSAEAAPARASPADVSNPVPQGRPEGSVQSTQDRPGGSSQSTQGRPISLASAHLNRNRKRHMPPVHGGVVNSYEDKDNDFVCPICFDMIEEAHMTKCGHSFCYRCIQKSLEQANRCPKCNFIVEKIDQVFPNFLLNELILKHKQKMNDRKKIKLENKSGHCDLVLEPESLDLANVNYLLSVLTQKKHQLEGECQIAQNQILKEFLSQVRSRKQSQLDQLSRELGLIDGDLGMVEKKLIEHRKVHPHLENGVDAGSHVSAGAAAGAATEQEKEGFNATTTTTNTATTTNTNISATHLHTTLAARRKQVNQHFDDLQKCYFLTRQRTLLASTPSTTVSLTSPNSAGTTIGSTIASSSSTIASSSVMTSQNNAHSTTPYNHNMMLANSACNLEEFAISLSKFTKYSSCRPLATLNYASDIYNTSSIVSSVEFDRDSDYFAIAGVTKKIKVFEYGTVIKDALDVHYPVNEMVCNSKISSVIWSSYHKGMLASSDYDGTVTLWDVFRGVKSKVFQEHEKRCWSVDFNRMDPKLLASGSDDSKVKLWYTNMEHSVASIEAKANVCCVKFNPESRYHLTFGSADHCVHYYDLRNTKTAVQVYKGHRKAVSYAKFVSGTEIVSASTDSQLKLWSLVDKPHCQRTFQGHSNEKNFVGLATDGDYIACGSETNSLYIYYKGLSKQLLTYKFDTVRSVLDKEKKEDDAGEFVSAVCWKPDSNVVLAANSQGSIKVLELV